MCLPAETTWGYTVRLSHPEVQSGITGQDGLALAS